VACPLAFAAGWEDAGMKAWWCMCCTANRLTGKNDSLLASGQRYFPSVLVGYVLNLASVHIRRLAQVTLPIGAQAALEVHVAPEGC
jgi:hypothetical protein